MSSPRTAQSSSRSARLAPAERRDAILRAALAVIARSGFAGTRLRDVAAEAGVAHGLIRHYFGSRESLLAAAFDLAATEEIEALDAVLSGRSDVIDALVAYCRPTSEQHYLLWVDAWSEAPRNPELAATLRHHHRACDDHLRAIIETGRAQGLFTFVDVDAAVCELVAVLDGLAVQEFALGFLNRSQSEHLALSSAERILGCDPELLAGAGAADAHT